MINNIENQLIEKSSVQVQPILRAQLDFLVSLETLQSLAKKKTDSPERYSWSLEKLNSWTRQLEKERMFNLIENYEIKAL